MRTMVSYQTDITNRYYMRHSPACTIIQIQNWSASGGIETMLLTSSDQF